MRKKQDKQHRFYTNEHRNERWTEEPKGRPIDFADKYTEDGAGSNKYSDERRARQYKAKRKKENRIKAIKASLAFVLTVALLFCGYTVMDIHMIRQAKPAEMLIQKGSSQGNVIAQMNIEMSAVTAQSISLDNSTMLASVINDAHSLECNSIVFDAKREDGTIGYSSSLATIDTFGAISNVGSDTEGSIKQLISNDIMPVARICCYKDNVLPAQDNSYAVLKNQKPYKDSDGNSYLNPNSPQAYNYILDIIRELNGYGVQAFILYGYDLPDDVAEKYDDGFESLSKKLLNDLDSQVKLLSEVKVSVSGMDAESGKITNSAIDSQIKEFEKINDNQVYRVSTKLDTARVCSHLANAGVSRYFVAQ